MMTVRPDLDDPKFKHRRMTCRAFVQLPIYADGVDAIIDTQILKTSCDILFRLVTLDYGRKTFIGTLKKEMGGIPFKAAPKS